MITHTHIIPIYDFDNFAKDTINTHAYLQYGIYWWFFSSVYIILYHTFVIICTILERTTNYITFLENTETMGVNNVMKIIGIDSIACRAGFDLDAIKT